MRRNRLVHLGATLGLGALLALSLRIGVPGLSGALSGGAQLDSGLDMILVPPTDVSQLVNSSAVIFVGRLITVTNGDMWIVATESPGGIPPADETPLTETVVEVDAVIKSGGLITAGQRITLFEPGHVPVTAEALSIDAASFYPYVWPAGSEFVWFLAVDPDGRWYPPDYPCGRILTDATQVSCSDGARTVPAWMSGMDTDDLVAAVMAEVNSPSPTSTYSPWPTSTWSP